MSDTKYRHLAYNNVITSKSTKELQAYQACGEKSKYIEGLEIRAKSLSRNIKKQTEELEMVKELLKVTEADWKKL